MANMIEGHKEGGLSQQYWLGKGCILLCCSQYTAQQGMGYSLQLLRSKYIKKGHIWLDVFYTSNSLIKIYI